MSNRVKTAAQIGVYEIDGDEVNPTDKHLTVGSHWNWHDRVVLIIAGKRYTVIAGDLKAAIDAATRQP